MELGDEAPTALYRLYDAEDRLLYVGISGDLKERLKTHASLKPWWPDVVRKTVQWYATRADAAEAEIKAIGSERPLHNVAGAVPGGTEFDLSDLRKVVTGAEILDLAVQKMPPMTLRLRMLELAGFPTRAALDALGVQPTHRSRVIFGKTGGQPSARSPRGAR